MTDIGTYEASAVKRHRATRSEMEERAEFLIAYAERHGPISVRGLYYQAEVAGIDGNTMPRRSYWQPSSEQRCEQHGPCWPGRGGGGGAKISARDFSSKPAQICELFLKRVPPNRA